MSRSSQRVQHILQHLQQYPDSADEFVQLIEQKIQKIFKPLLDMNTSERNRRMYSQSIDVKPCASGEPVEDPGEPSDRFVSLSRNLQSDTSIGYDNFKQASRSRTTSHAHGPRGEAQAIDVLFDPRIMLGSAALGLALSFLPSSTPVTRSLLSRVWPSLVQFGLAYLIHIRKQQDLRSNTERSNGVLYIVSALIQFFTAIRDYQGHTPASFVRRALLGPLDNVLVYMKQILIALPSFLFKTIFLSGVSLLGKIAIVGTLTVSVVVALGLLIVMLAENM